MRADFRRLATSRHFVFASRILCAAFQHHSTIITMLQHPWKRLSPPAHAVSSVKVWVKLIVTSQPPDTEFLVILYTYACVPLTWGPVPLGSALLCIHIIGTERRAQVRPNSSIFEQYEPWTNPRLNLRRTWVCCTVNSHPLKLQPLMTRYTAVTSLHPRYTLAAGLLILWKLVVGSGTLPVPSPRG